MENSSVFSLAENFLSQPLLDLDAIGKKMNKALTIIVIGIVGSPVLASSVVLDSFLIENIEGNINVLKDKVVAFSENEEKLVRKYME